MKEPHYAAFDGAALIVWACNVQRGSMQSMMHLLEQDRGRQ